MFSRIWTHHLGVSFNDLTPWTIENHISAPHSAFYWLHAIVGEFRFWDSYLSADAVLGIYNSTKSRYGL